jgi:quercetin dioxygenase-like cupin family protein
MFKKLVIGISFVAALFIATITIADDAVDADPKHYTVEFENDKVRIIRIKYGPGEESVMHSHAQHVAITLTVNSTRMTMPDGTSEEATTVAGAADWSDATEHLPANLSDEPLEVILIEIK